MGFNIAFGKVDAFSTISLLSTVAYASILCSVVAFGVNRFLVYRHLRQFKGPWLATFSKLWMMKCTFKGTMHLDVAEVCARYGTGLNSTVQLLLSVPDRNSLIHRSPCPDRP